MATWVLVVYIGAAQAYVPLTTHPTEQACRLALQEWTFEAGTSGTCLPGTIEIEAPRRRRR